MKCYEPLQLCSEQWIYRPQKYQSTLMIEFTPLTQCCADGSIQLLGEGSPSLQWLWQWRIGVEGNGLHSVDTARVIVCLCATDDKEQVWKETLLTSFMNGQYNICPDSQFRNVSPSWDGIMVQVVSSWRVNRDRLRSTRSHHATRIIRWRRQKCAVFPNEIMWISHMWVEGWGEGVSGRWNA